MTAVRLQAYGGPEQLTVEEVPDPTPGPGQVLVRVRAASVNPWDVKLASGCLREQVDMKLPYIPGGDFSGVVEVLGSGVTSLRVGDDVYGTCASGAYAQQVAASTQRTAGAPRTCSPIEAASVPVAAQTAWQGLFAHGKLQPGESVLIHGAAGGVGSFAVQLARWKGARVVATASANHATFVRSFGAIDVIDYNAGPFEAAVRDVDLVLDLVGGDTQERSFSVLKRGGRLVSTVDSPREAVAARAGVRATLFHMRGAAVDLAQLGALLDAGDLKAPVTRTYPLECAGAAWTQSRTGHTHGKMVLEIPA